MFAAPESTLYLFRYMLAVTKTQKNNVNIQKSAAVFRLGMPDWRRARQGNSKRDVDAPATGTSPWHHKFISGASGGAGVSGCEGFELPAGDDSLSAVWQKKALKCSLLIANSLWRTTKKPQRRQTEPNSLFSCSSATFLPKKLRSKREMSCRLSWLPAATWSRLYHFLCVFVFSLPPSVPALVINSADSAGRVPGRAAADGLTVGRGLRDGCGAIWRRPRSSSARPELIISLTRNWTVTRVRETFQSPELDAQTFQNTGDVVVVARRH